MVNEPALTCQVDLDAVEEWISVLHGASPGYLHICSTQSWVGKTFPLDHMELIKSYITWLDGQGAKGIYLRLTTVVSPDLKPGARGSDDDSHTLPGLWADLDIAGPGHKTTKPLPPNEAEAKRIVAESGLPEPTYWVHSGGGLYGWWLLDNPIDVTDPQARTSTQDFSRRWQDALTAAAERIGYSYGGLGDLARVTRIPGTVNRKIENDPKLCRLLPDESSGRLYSPSELADGLTAAEAKTNFLAKVKTEVPKPIPAQRESSERVGDRPGDELANRLSWEEILTPHGYQFDRRHGVEDYWVRPGKHRRDGHSCTTNYGGSGLLYVFSTEMEGFEANESYSKFAAWSILNGYGRDFKTASKALRAQGYGSQREPLMPPQPFQPSKAGDAAGEAPVDSPAATRPPQVQDFSFTDLGAAELTAAMYGDRFRHVVAFDQWMYWTGQVWKADETSAVARAVQGVAKMIVEQGQALRDAPGSDHDGEAKVCRCQGCLMVKHGTASQARTKTKGIIGQFGDLAGIAASPDAFDLNRSLLTVDNGVLDLDTGQLGPFKSSLMLTRRLGAAYDPQATAPRFAQFMSEVLPSAEVREYVQRAIGYTLTGESDQRALFLLHGLSGTGKSQFLKIMGRLFGAFAATAEESTFNVTRSEATNNLHSLRGARFVSMSETADSVKLNEALVKRVTGGDPVTTRELYQRNVTWTPEFVLWMATNFPPKMNAEDGAIWARYKPIHFGVQFSRAAGTEVANIGDSIFAEEASGILNWALEGLAKYRQFGLGEPGEVVQEAQKHRLESDTVAQFIEDRVEEGSLVRQDDTRIKSSVLYQMYEQWCARERYVPVGQKRFSLRMQALGFERKRSDGMVWVGISLAPGVGFFGSMG